MMIDGDNNEDHGNNDDCDNNNDHGYNDDHGSIWWLWQWWWLIMMAMTARTPSLSGNNDADEAGYTTLLKTT